MRTAGASLRLTMYSGDLVQTGNLYSARRTKKKPSLVGWALKASRGGRGAKENIRGLALMSNVVYAVKQRKATHRVGVQRAHQKASNK